MVKANGSFSPSDCTGDNKVATLMFPSPCKLEQNVIYIARVSLKGKHYTIGTEGKQSVIGQGGVVITFHSTGLVESNQNTGPLAKFHCSRYSVHVHVCVLMKSACYWNYKCVHVQCKYYKCI